MAAAPACDGPMRVDGNVQLEWLSPELSNYLIRQVDTFDQVVFRWMERQWRATSYLKDDAWTFQSGAY